ncbi:MAG: AbgT family transporter [Synergistaceae bacterium]|nr:AbgT family transporter [Synergistaceae bacterium]
MSETASTEKKGALYWFIRGVEIVGNKLPHPFWLFVLLALIVLFCSAWFKGTSVSYMVSSGGAAPKETTVAVANLLTYDAMRSFFASFVKTYVNFAPLGLVLTMMLGIGLVEQTGMISALMRKTILGAPNYLITAVVAIVGINANIASDAGIVFTPVVAAAVFKALGRNPWVGIAVGYSAAQGGFTANLFIAGTDALLSGITKSAAEGVPAIPIDTPINPLINWYFMIVATVLLTFVTVWVTEKYTVKFLGDTDGLKDEAAMREHAVTPAENRGLYCALAALILYIALITYLTVPEGSFFRNPKDGSLVPSSPLLSCVMPILFFLFFFVGIAYGYGAGVIKRGEDIPKLMAKGIGGSISFIVVVLPASMFIELFRVSRFDVVLSVSGADWLKTAQVPNVVLIVAFILLVTCINLFMSSGSAKWLILAPIFVPMFAQLGFSPALTQAIYRVGDSCTNNISPLSYYVPVIIGLLEQYKPEGYNERIGIGSMISMMMPYSIFYLISFTIFLVIWYLIGLPLGPGAPAMLG